MNITDIPTESKLVVVRIVTTLGSEYVMPDIVENTLDMVLPRGGDPKALHGQLCIVNVSLAVLSVPMRIVKSVTVNGKVRWPD